MKNLQLIFFFFLFVVISISSCKKEEEIVDNIRKNLSTSITTYDNAPNGAWIEITESEYNLLANSLSSVSKSGTTDDLFNVTENNSGSHEFTLSNEGYPIPNQSYLFAYKYKLKSADTVHQYGIKISETRNDTLFSNVTSLPSHVGVGVKCFLLKGASYKTNNIAYLAFNKPLGVRVGGLWTALTGKSYYYNDGDNSNLPFKFDGYAFYQGLSTTSKQW